MKAQQLGRKIRELPTEPFLRLGTVTAYNAGPPATVTATIGGQSLTGIPLMGHVDVTISQACWFLTMGEGKIIGIGETTATDEYEVPRIRLTATTDASESSTGHALQIGPTSGNNLIADVNEIMARDNGSESALFLNSDGNAKVEVGEGGFVSRGAINGAWTTVTTGASAASGWTVSSYQHQRCGDWVQFRLIVERTGTDITVSSTYGDITNTTVATLPTSARGTLNASLSAGGGGVTGRMCAGTYNPSTGVVQVTATAGTADITSGDQLTIGGMFYVG